MEENFRRGDFSRIIKQIDDSIEASSSSGRDESKVTSQIYCNRGFCHQRLNLNRKALKVNSSLPIGYRFGVPYSFTEHGTTMTRSHHYTHAGL